MTRMTMLLSTLLFTGVVHAQAPAKPRSTEDGQVAQLADAKWTAPKVPEIPVGAMAAPIAGDPTSGGSIGYAKFPAGYAFPAHWHSHTEYTVLISGKASFTVDGKSHELVPGSYIVIPPKAEHHVTCGAGAECLLLTRRAGPTDYHFVPKK